MHKHPANIQHIDEASFGERLADRVASGMGSWAFIMVQTAIIIIWITYNGWVASRVMGGKPFDIFPFVLLNLVFSTQAAYAAPILQLASNRQSEHDRLRAEEDYKTNDLSLEEIRANTDLTREVHALMLMVRDHVAGE